MKKPDGGARGIGLEISVGKRMTITALFLAQKRAVHIEAYYLDRLAKRSWPPRDEPTRGGMYDQA